jgi:hypothetical protein
LKNCCSLEADLAIPKVEDKDMPSSLISIGELEEGNPNLNLQQQIH